MYVCMFVCFSVVYCMKKDINQNRNFLTKNRARMFEHIYTVFEPFITPSYGKIHQRVIIILERQ